ncbi:heterokaryon incompatibility protein-domain-containing protein [Xylaria flabelliformis]|nr:heterokaryon incompatibility protein-domain-containing protein [Xylaria flabelliformis]
MPTEAYSITSSALATRAKNTMDFPEWPSFFLPTRESITISEAYRLMQSPPSQVTVPKRMLSKVRKLLSLPKCSSCNDLVPQTWRAQEQRYYLDIEIPLLQLRKTAKAGCPTCQIINKGYKHFAKAFANSGIRKDLHITNSFDYGPTRQDGIMVYCGDATSLALHFHTERDGDSPWPLLGASTWCVSQPSLEYSKGFIEMCFAMCEHYHEKCRRSSRVSNNNSSVDVPDRLLHVGGPAEDIAPALIESAEFLRKADADKRYIALSHCWGHTLSIKTTKSNYESFKKSIEWSALPKTFQEAINVTKALGVRFIWIDSLCIIQDDLQDWEIQAAKMSSVYQNAYLTLAATGATGSSEGLFLPRSDTYKISGIHNKLPYTIHVRQILDHGPFQAFPNPSLAGQRVRELPGMKRAWMLQEQVLSPRLVHFTEDELIWECQSDVLCECGFVHLNWKKEIFGFKSNIISWAGDYSKGIANWYATMQSYIPRGLTYDRDRLPAISALAKLFSELGGLGRYCAGIWASEIISGLMWQASQPGRRTHPDGVFGSKPPTWSWASVESCRIQWQFLDERYKQKPEAEVLDIACYPSTRDPRGMVSGGYVTLRSKLLALSIKWHSHTEAEDPPPGSEGYFVSVRDNTPWPKTIDWAAFKPGDKIEIPSEGPELARFAIQIYPDVPLYSPSEGLKSGGRIYFLKMALVSFGSREGQAYGLFLREVDPLSEVPVAAPDALRNRRLFRRIGFGVIQSDDVGKDLEILTNGILDALDTDSSYNGSQNYSRFNKYLSTYFWSQLTTCILTHAKSTLVIWTNLTGSASLVSHNTRSPFRAVNLEGGNSLFYLSVGSYLYAKLLCRTKNHRVISTPSEEEITMRDEHQQQNHVES